MPQFIILGRLVKTTHLRGRHRMMDFQHIMVKGLSGLSQKLRHTQLLQGLASGQHQNRIPHKYTLPCQVHHYHHGHPHCQILFAGRRNPVILIQGMRHTGNKFILLRQTAGTQFLAGSGKSIAVILFHHGTYRMEISQVIAQIFLRDIVFPGTLHKRLCLSLNFVIRRDLIHVPEHLPEVNPVIADSITGKQPHQIAAAGIDRSRRLLRIRQNQDLGVLNRLAHLHIFQNLIVLLIIMRHVRFQPQIPVVPNQVNGSRPQVNHGNRLVQALNPRHAVGNQIQVHFVVGGNQLLKLRIPHHKTFIKLHIHRLHQITAGKVKVLLQFLIPDLKLLLSHPTLILRSPLLFHAHPAGTLPPVRMYQITEYRSQIYLYIHCILHNNSPFPFKIIDLF